MKKVIIILFGLLPLTMMAQVNRSKAPAPLPAPQIKVGKPATFTLANGLKVFVVQNTKLPRVSATLTFDTDGIIEGDKSGLTDLAGSLLRRGTIKMPKEKLDEEIDFLGANIGTSAWNVSASSLKNNFPRVMSLMSDIVLNPSLPAVELEKLRKQSLSGLQAAKESPDAIAANVVNRLAYGKNHPYGDIETEETVKNVTLADIRKFFATYWKPNNAYLVLVGDISAPEAKALAELNFKTWKRGDVPKQTYEAPKTPAKTYIAIVDRPSSTQSVINFITPLPLKPGSPDVIPVSVMNNILGAGSTSRLFMNLREKYGFTYGAYSNVKSDRLIGSFTASASVRNEKTDSAVGQFLNEFNRIRTEPLSDTAVRNMKNFLSGSFARSLENPGTIAAFALNTARYNLPENYYQDYLKNLAAVTPQSAQTVASKYVIPNQMHIIIVGNAKEIAPGLEKYGEVRYFDMYGNPVSAPVVKTVQSGVTAESILQKSITASGGEMAINALKDVQLNGSVSVMGQSLSISQKHVFPSVFSLELGMPGMVLQKKLLKNGAFTLAAQGAAQVPEASDKEEMLEEAGLVSEIHLLKQKDYQFTLGGIEQVDGKDAYVVKIKTPAAREYSNYYDVASGLKVKQSKVEDGPQGSVSVSTTFADYKPFAGVQIPTKMVINQGPLKLDVSFNDIKVNTGLKADDVK